MTPMNTFRHCLPRWAGGHIASPHSLVWKKAFLSGLCSTTTTLSGPVNFWTRAVGLCWGWLSHPQHAHVASRVLRQQKHHLLNSEPWGSATAQAATLRVQNKSTLIESSAFKKSVLMTVSIFSHMGNLWRSLHLFYVNNRRRQSGSGRGTYKIFWCDNLQDLI